MSALHGRPAAVCGRRIWLCELGEVLEALESLDGELDADLAVQHLRQVAETAERKGRTAIQYTPPLELAPVVTRALVAQRPSAQ